jgi:molybdate transport system ATP-binding protein
MVSGAAMTLSIVLKTRLSPAFALDLTAECAPGVTIVFGASGSGKTTLLRAVAGLIEPDEGRLAIGDHVLFDRAAGTNIPVQHRQVGYVFQQLALFPHMSVRQNIGYGLSHRPVDRTARVERIAADFQIAHLLERPPAEISGGERQRVALARALVIDPCLLLLDEPLSALDYVTQSRIMDDLRRWNAERQIPILYVTHGHREVFALGHRVIVLEAGRVVADGTPQEVMHAPTLETVAQLAGFENVIDANVVGTRADAGTMECRPGGTAVDLEVPYAPLPVGTPVRLAIRAGDILVATEPPRGLSARNVVSGVIRSLVREGTTVRLGVDAGVTLHVHVTPAAVSSLSLTIGQQVWLIIKTHSIRRVN